jgi:DNA-binding FadR family transcriptional regulator
MSAQVAGGGGLVRPMRLGAVLMAELIQRIAAGTWKEGELLPTEVELQAEFTVSRTALREGLKGVEDRGMISIRQGRGALVQPVATWNVLDPLVLSALIDHHPTPEIFEQVMATRMMIEPELAREAATSIADPQLDRMAALLELMAAELKDPDNYLEPDVQFHRLLAEASPNLVARAIMTSIEQPLRSSRRLTNTIPQALDQAQAEHQQIYERLRDRDADGAALAMREHLLRSEQQLLRRWRRRPAKTRR